MEAARLEEIKKILPQTTKFNISLDKEEGTYINSKFGGSFYWPTNTPPDMLFLAQINFSELPENDIFPKTGLLQFFVTNKDNYGVFEKDNCKVVYHKDISNGFECTCDEEYSPISKKHKITFELTKEYLTYCDYRFRRYIKQTDLDEDLYDEFSGQGSKLLGYPFFVQYDPRRGKKYDTLLLQIDSDNKNIVWGDCGVANFFINSEKLAALDFSDIYFTWDCC